MRRRLGQVVKRDAEDYVDGQQQQALHPVRLAVVRHEPDDQHRNHDRHDCQHAEDEIESGVETRQIADEDQQRREEAV